MPKRRSSGPSHSRSSAGRPHWKGRKVPREALTRPCRHKPHSGPARGTSHVQAPFRHQTRRERPGANAMLPASRLTHSTLYVYHSVAGLCFEASPPLLPPCYPPNGWMCQDHRNTRKRNRSLAVQIVWRVATCFCSLLTLATQK